MLITNRRFGTTYRFPSSRVNNLGFLTLAYGADFFLMRMERQTWRSLQSLFANQRRRLNVEISNTTKGTKQKHLCISVETVACHFSNSTQSHNASPQTSANLLANVSNTFGEKAPGVLIDTSWILNRINDSVHFRSKHRAMRRVK